MLGNKFQGRLNKNTTSFIQENKFENTINKMTAILSSLNMLTHWGPVTHSCVSKLIIIGSDNGLSPGRRQAII